MSGQIAMAVSSSTVPEVRDLPSNRSIEQIISLTGRPLSDRVRSLWMYTFLRSSDGND